MIGRFFWPVFAIVLAVTTHVAFVLFAPKMLFGSQTTQAASLARDEFTILDSTTRRKLLPSLMGPGVAAFCSMDLTNGPVRIEMKLPKVYWSLAIFSQSGKQLYTINDQQADTDSIVIDLVRAASLVDQVLAGGADEESINIENAAWRVELIDPRAYAVLWLPVDDALLVDSARATIGASICRTKPNA